MVPLVRRNPASRVAQVPITFQPLIRPVLLRTRAWTCTAVPAGVTAFHEGSSSVKDCPGWTHQEVQRDQDQLRPAVVNRPTGWLIDTEPPATRVPSFVPARNAASVVTRRKACWAGVSAVRRARSWVTGSVSTTPARARTRKPAPSIVNLGGREVWGSTQPQ